ncbi:MAG TPA: hypothetical protein VHA06_04255 [Candidatus Angelobacter sp.]|jgi:hypothetical protein|nr:hypothetical protein [Candidatus Angelobacter sp.]
MPANLIHRIITEAGRLAERPQHEAVACFGELSHALRCEWEALLISDAADLVLQRRFNYDFRLLNDTGLLLEQAVTNPGDDDSTVAVMDKLAALCCYLNAHGRIDAIPEHFAFCTYSRLFIAQLEPLARQAEQCCGNDPELAELLFAYIRHMQDSGNRFRQTHQALRYFAGWLRSLAAIGAYPAELQRNELIRRLIHANFNYLPFISYCQQALRRRLEGIAPAEQLALLRLESQQVGHSLTRPSDPFDPLWPSAADLLGGWLLEQLAALDPARRQPAAITCGGPKFPLNISVAHLACFLKVFYEDAVTSAPASELIRWASLHFSAKRQGDISAKGLAKEFYGINQFTAARVRDMLLRMAGHITARYFPVVAAAAPLIYVAEAIRLILRATGG